MFRLDWFFLSKLNDIIGSGNGGLYKDDGLLAIQGSGPEIEKIKKSIVALFKGMDMCIEIGNTCVRTDYLDIIIDLENDTYEPFTKENSTIQYIDKGSNHPPVVLRNLLKMIEKRISNLSCSKIVIQKQIFI